MTSESPRPTFRDPAGSLTFTRHHAVRTIGDGSRESVLEFLSSDLCRRAQGRGDLIASEIDPSSHGTLRLLHPRIPVPTYPWEWTAAQWLAAAELTLSLGQEAIADGWILKDATPLNILFDGTRPVFVDILSFERRDPESSVWLAYGQYVRTILLPLLTHRMLHWRLALTLFRRDGYEPSEIYRALSWPQRLAPGMLWSVTLPTLLERRSANATQSAATPRRPTPPDVASAVLTRTLTSLGRQTRRAIPRAANSNWSDYPATANHYTAEQSADKTAWVRRVLESIRPVRLLDIGANTGEYSALAAGLGAEVVALERDEAAADRIFAMARDRRLRILPIHADLARPTPAVGWENSESPSLLSRLQGKFDTVLMLAVIHHLILMEQIPIPAIIALMYRLTQRHLIVEWVPVDDPMFQALMRGRNTLYGAISETDLLDACAGLFVPVDRHELGNRRVLLHLQKIVAD